MNLNRSLLTLLFSGSILSPAIGEDIHLNFSILGEINRLNILGYGGLALEVTTYSDGFGTEIRNSNTIDVTPGAAAWDSTGVFSGLVAPLEGWWVLDRSFSIPVSLPLGSNQLDIGFSVDALRLIYDFANEVSYGAAFPGNPLQLDPRRQGLYLNSITLSNGQALSTAGLAAVFIQPETTITTSAAVATIDEDVIVFAPGSEVVSENELSYARAKIGATSAEPLIYLPISPQPYPLLGGAASVSVRNRSAVAWDDVAENFAIYRLRTAPTTLRIASTTDSSVTLTWDSNAGEGFAVQQSFDLITWTTIKDFVLGTTESTVFVDFNNGPSAVQKCFYRLIVNPYLIQ